MPSAIPCSLSPLISSMHSCFFSDWKRTVSSKFWDTQAAAISSEKLVLRRHARCVLSRLRCNGHRLILLTSYLSRIGRIENPSSGACGRPSIASLISFCTDHLGILCAARSLVTLCLCKTSCPGPGELPGFWGSMVFRHAPSLGRDQVTTTTNVVVDSLP